MFNNFLLPGCFIGGDMDQVYPFGYVVKVIDFNYRKNRVHYESITIDISPGKVKYIYLNFFSCF